MGFIILANDIKVHEPIKLILSDAKVAAIKNSRRRLFLLCFLHISFSTSTAVALVVNQDVTVYLSGEAASQPPTIQRVQSGSPPSPASLSNTKDYDGVTATGGVYKQLKSVLL
jgi:hypothetical protein